VGIDRYARRTAAWGVVFHAADLFGVTAFGELKSTAMYGCVDGNTSQEAAHGLLTDKSLLAAPPG
jgi:hypothetical protein